LPEFSNRLKAVALLDRDIARAPAEPNVYALPVSMIENFLLDPLPIWESLQSVLEKTPFKTIDDVTAYLDKLMDELEAAEVERRAKVSLGIVYFRPESPVTDIPRQAEEFSQSTLMRYSAESVRNANESASRTVNDLRAQQKRRESFHGRDAIDLFYKRFLHNTPLSKTVFKFEAARHARRRKQVTSFFEDFFDKLGLPRSGKIDTAPKE
jgi:hypothetical protein